MKKTLLGCLTGIVFMIFAQVHAQNTCFIDWQYVTPVSFSNFNPNPMSNRVVLLTIDTQTPISQGKMNADGSDIRFSDSDCCTELPYFIQSGINTSATRIWTVLPFVNTFGTATVNMYYGNSAMTTPVSHIDSVMLSIGNDDTGTDTLISDITVVTEAMQFPINCATVRWRVYTGDTARFRFKISNDTNMVIGTSPSFFEVPPTPGFYNFDFESPADAGSHPGFFVDPSFPNMEVMNSCVPVTPCPGSCGDLVFESGDRGIFTALKQFSCGAYPSLKVWYRDLSDGFLDPAAIIGSEFDRQQTFVASLNGSQTFCAGDSVELMVQDIGAPSYQWVRNGVWLNGATTRNIWVKDDGNYFCFATFGNCQTVSSNVIPLTRLGPMLDLGPDRVVCSDTGIVLDAGPGSTFLWNTGDTTQTLNVVASGTYWVTAWDSMGCFVTDTVSITLQNPPNAQINPSGDVFICNGSSVILDAFNPEFFVYDWNRNNETSANIIVDSAGSYYVVVYDSLNCSDTSNVVNVMFYPDPIFSFGPDTNYCENDTLVLDVGTGWTSIVWPDSSTGQTFDVTMPGSYSVTLTDSNGCMVSDTVDVSEGATPVVTIGADTAICPGDLITLDPGAGFDAYNWSNGETTQAIGVTAGMFQVTVTQSGCDGVSNMVTITEFTALTTPTVTFDGNTLSSTSAPNYQWLLNGNPINNATGQTYTPTEDGTYQVEVIDPNGCGNVISAAVEVILGITADDIPEGFSPNGDGINDNFMISGIDQFGGSTLTIINRWGNEVYKQAPYTNEFNGRSSNGNDLPDGTYFYILDLGDGSEAFSGYLIINR